MWSARACVCLALVMAACAASIPQRPAASSSGHAPSTADLRSIALDWADDMDVTVRGVQAVRTTDTAAYPNLVPGKVDEADLTGAAYWLVQVRADGAFDCECGVTGSGPPHYFAYLVRADDRSETNGAYLLSDPVSLNRFGTVIDIPQ